MLHPDGEGILNAAQRTAFERWLQRGKGLVGIHAAANADRNWDWMTDLRGGSLFANHPSGALQFQQATVKNVDANHPAMQGIPADWVRTDEWYNFTAEPQNVHVVAKLDESTYEEQDGSPEADDHPIAWCSNYDRGRTFYTALGHNGSAWSEPLYRQHIQGAIESVAGLAPVDCGAPRDGIPTDASFDKVTLDDNTENPMEIAIAPGGNVYYRRARRQGQVLQRDDPRGPDGRHDPGAPRQRERPARHRAGPELRHQQVAVPLLQRPVARGAARLALHRSARTATSTWPPRRSCCGSRTSGSSAATRPAR